MNARQSTSLLFVPALASRHLFGTPVRGAVSPVGIGVVVGAFLFGVGMQLAGACASGTLSAAGCGNTRLLVTLAAVIGGSVIGLAYMPWWEGMPAFAPVSLVHRFGPLFALSATLALCATVAALTVAWERRRHGRPLRRPRRQDDSTAMPPRGGRYLVAGALGLAAINIATLALAGRPWGITAAFGLWGSKALMQPADCCSATVRASRTAAISVRSSAESRPAVCTGGYGSRPRLAETSSAHGCVGGSGRRSSGPRATTRGPREATSWASVTSCGRPSASCADAWRPAPSPAGPEGPP